MVQEVHDTPGHTINRDRDFPLPMLYGIGAFYAHHISSFRRAVMESLYDRSAPKKATNLTINHDLLRQARELKINLSQTLEERLVEIIAQRRREQWLAENRCALDDYNRRIEERGVFSHGIRRF